MKKKVLIAMSGGVDSSAAALLLQKQGYECAGATLSLCGNETDGAKRIADGLGMPFYIFDEHELFAREVMDHFVSEYRAGRTPNPCIDCNRFIKFRQLLDRAELMGCSHIATGHYARCGYDEASGRWRLLRSADPDKDQTYVLWALTQEQLSHTLFPLGGLNKSEVRAIAAEQGFLNADKPDSQDICFVPDGDYAKFIEGYTGKKSLPGKFIDTSGKVLGEHKGIIHYTLGQRKRLGISLGHRACVTAIDPESNTVTLGDEPDLYTSRLVARDINLIAYPEITAPMRVEAKTRYRHKAAPATLTQTGPDELTLVFDEPQRAITRGQSVVIYEGDVVVGGGIIALAQNFAVIIENFQSPT